MLNITITKVVYACVRVRVFVCLRSYVCMDLYGECEVF